MLYLQCGSLQTHTQICLPHSRARDEFYLYHLGEPVPNEKKKKNAKQVADRYSAPCQGIQGREEQTKQMDVL